MSWPLRMFDPKEIYFVTVRCFQGRLLLRPSRETNEVLSGVLARAARLCSIELFGFVFASNHFHLILRAPERNLPRFMQFLLTNVSKKVGWLVAWRGAFWERRYSAEPVLDDEALLGRLRYILAHGVSHRGVLRQHYETDALDASTLLAAIFGFLPGTDERLRATALAVADELSENGFVLRYRTDETDDGLSGKEGTFLICSFWLVSALAITGEMQRAMDLMEHLLRIASPLGLYAEEFDAATGRHLGNFPQAFSHLALIEAAARIILAERLQGVA